MQGSHWLHCCWGQNFCVLYLATPAVDLLFVGLSFYICGRGLRSLQHQVGMLASAAKFCSKVCCTRRSAKASSCSKKWRASTADQALMADHIRGQRLAQKANSQATPFDSGRPCDYQILFSTAVFEASRQGLLFEAYRHSRGWCQVFYLVDRGQAMHQAPDCKRSRRKARPRRGAVLSKDHAWLMVSVEFARDHIFLIASVSAG